jgi:alpha-2-macroglobulin
MLRLLLVSCLVCVTAPTLAQEYQSKELADAARDWRQELIDSVPANKKQPNLAAALRQTAEIEYQAKDYAAAIGKLTNAIANGADDGLVWLRLAQSEFAANDDHAMASAYNAYLKSTDPVERGAALFVIGRDYDRHDKQKEALAAFDAGLGFTNLSAIAERAEELRRLVAFRVTKVEVQAEAEAARACLRFNEHIATKGDISYSAFVRSEPKLDGIVTGRGDTLCLEGMKHGAIYNVEVLSGFPAMSGEHMHEKFATRIVIPDRKPQIRFSGTGYVLPEQDTSGLPVTTVNVDKVKLRLLRVNERNLVPSIDAERLTMSFSSYEVDEIINRTGSLVWEGEMAVSGERNRAVTTAIPLKDMLREKGPGIYLAVAERSDLRQEEYAEPATNWVLVSNLGLATYKGIDGLAVDVRSLADGKPFPGIAVRLYARNNGELAEATSDAGGIARIPGGSLRGRGGDEPFVVTAHGPDNDFNFLEIGRAAFDLSDRGVSGRSQPGPVDAFLYTDRGIYRPGETVELVALVRDDKAEAISGLPIAVRLLRPDGIEVEHRVLSPSSLGNPPTNPPGDRLGAYHQSFALPRDARTGAWQLELRLDPKAPPIGRAEFRVEDFVPPQLKVELSAVEEPIRPAEAFPVEIAARYYYGAPGAGLGTEAEAVIALDDHPFPNYPDFQFGLVGEEFTADRRDLEAPATDEDGKARLSVALNDLPDLTRPLAATIRVGVFEPSGRAVSETLTRPIRQRPLAIGLRSPAGADAIPEGAEAALEVIAVDPKGTSIAAKGLRFELLRETWEYRWYSLNGMWRHKSHIRSQPIDAGVVDVGTDGPAKISRQLPAGRYRWEVADAANGAQSSLRFHVGWWVEAEQPDVPDKLEAAVDKVGYRPGEIAKLFVKAPFAGEAELAIASDRVLSLRALSLPAEGITIDVPVDPVWGSGVYALVSAYRPSDIPGPQQRGPGRAVGVAWLGIDSSPRTLAAALVAPAGVRPRSPVEIGVKVAGLAAGEEAYVTVAAVDEAVLKLTEFESPAPERYYFGKRRLGVELRDLYGRLIDGRANMVGVLRSGGDSFAKRSVAGLPDKSSKVVALFSGLVRLDGDGAARVRFDVPDFQGQLRLMAVAFSAHKVGSGVATMTVRDPVVTTVALPRFLAPGDSARVGVTVNNLEGDAGNYQLTLSTSGAVQFPTSRKHKVHLDTNGNFADGFMLSAAAPGNVALKLELLGPGDLKVVRDFTVGVRPAQAYQLRRFVGRLEPGEGVTLDDGAAGEFLPGTAEALLSVSPRPDWDVPGLLRALGRYPYGCLEQTTSRAMPLLYVEEAARLWHSDPGRATAETLDRAIGHVVELQRSDGSFGVWSDSGDTVPWLDAYAADFLIRAKEHGRNVPDFAIKSAVGWLHDYVRREHTGISELPAVAYAHYVLARAKSDDLDELRYFNDTQLARLPTQLAKAQIAAALAQYGDAARAAAAYDEALIAGPRRSAAIRYVDYGSELRDGAAVLAFAAANPGSRTRLTAVIDRIAERFTRAAQTSTQEQAWLLIAAEAAVQAGGGEMTVAVGDGAPATRSDPVYLRRQLGSGSPDQTVTNRGSTPVWRSVSITGVPMADLPAESKGYAVTRNIYRPDGAAADLGSVRQTDLFVIVIKGTRTDAAQAVQTLVVDLLPAGFEIETATVSKGRSTTDYSWLPKLTEATYIEERDDRFVAALDLKGGVKDFTLAYVVRAVTAGEFTYPALGVEDMYEPETTGRTAIGKLTIAPR